MKQRILSRILAAGVLALAFLPAVALPQDLKIGFINTDRIFREATIAKAALTKLEAEFSKRERDLVAQGEALRVASERFEREAPTLSETQRNTRQRALVEQDRDFQRKRREFLEDQNTRKNEEQQALLERANRIVRQFAETEKFDLILQEPPAYVSPRLDITDRVIRALDAAGSR